MQPLCAILGACVRARSSTVEGTAAGVAASAQLVTTTRTAECILTCLHAMFERNEVADPLQARCSSACTSQVLVALHTNQPTARRLRLLVSCSH